MIWNSLSGDIALTLWGSHERAAAVSHRPDDVRRLFCDANASALLADAIVAGPCAPLLNELARLRARPYGWASGPELARRIAIGDAVLAWDDVSSPGEAYFPLDIAARIIPHLLAIGEAAAQEHQ